MTTRAVSALAFLLTSILATASDRALEIRETAISPDGSHVAWVQEVAEKPGSAIFVHDLRHPGAATAIMPAGAGKRGIAWSPDGRSLAFLAGRELYAHSLSQGVTKRLVTLKGPAADPRWSPDGKSVAVLVTENAEGPQGPTAPKSAVPSGVQGPIPEQRIVIVDAAGGTMRAISPTDLYVYEYDWSPDGKAFAAIGAHGDGDNNWYIAQLYVIAASGGDARSIWKPPFQMAVPRWSPDGASVAVIQGLMSDEGIVGGDVYLVAVSGGSARNLTPGMKASASSLVWQSPNQLLVSESIDGHGGLATLDVAGGKLSQIDTPAASGVNGAISLSRDGQSSALVLYEFDRPPEVWAGLVGAWKQVTHINDPAKVQASWGKAVSVHWTNQGLPIQGWLIYPKQFDAGRRYPMLVAVHGGPSSMARPRWAQTVNAPYLYQVALLSASGYFVFLPNARGSYGQGEAFTQANVKDFGHGDLSDTLSGVETVVQGFPVDGKRIGLAGWSYGGYMAMWAATQTQRFGAIVAGAGIANWQSYYGENAIDQWLIPFFGASVYDDPAVYRRSSPIEFIKQAKTPTLMLVGERDGECPLPQSQEFWHALQTLRVETGLVVYPGEGHQIVNEEHRRDVVRRTLEWLNRHLPPAGGER